MATSFQSGFHLGTSMYNDSQRAAIAREELAMRQAQDARAAEEFGWRRDEAARTRAQNAEVDALTQQLTRPNADNYAFAPGNGTGLGLRNTMPADAADTASVPPMTGLRMPAGGEGAASTGLRAPAVSDRPLTFNQAPTGAAAEEILGRRALVKGDDAGYRASQAASKNFKYEDAYKKHMADWNAMDDAAKGALIDKLSLDSGVRGFGSWVPGKGKSAGYMNYLPPGGDPVKLSSKEAADLYALTNLMEVDPTRARAEMDKVSDKVRAVAVQAFDAQTKGVTANNTAAHYANADANDAARTGMTGQYYRALADKASRPQAGDLREFQDAKGNVVMVDITGLKRGPDGTVQMPQGLKPRTAKPEFTPKVYAETIKLYTEAGYSQEDARMMADRDYGRGPTGNSDQRLQDRNKAAASQQKPIEVRPGEVIARDPNTKIRGPIASFQRESVRQPLWKGGGLSYVYRDPVTNQTYTIDEYNKLLSE